MDFINAHDHQAFLGTHFVNRQDEIVLRIGSREWTRTQLVQQIGIGNIAAAGKLSQICRKAGIKSTEALYAIDPREFALVKGLGETTVYVCLAILSAEGFNVGRWYAQVEGRRKKNITFRTMKIRSTKGKRRG